MGNNSIFLSILEALVKNMNKIFIRIAGFFISLLYIALGIFGYFTNIEMISSYGLKNIIIGILISSLFFLAGIIIGLGIFLKSFFKPIRSIIALWILTIFSAIICMYGLIGTILQIFRFEIISGNTIIVFIIFLSGMWIFVPCIKKLKNIIRDKPK